MDACQTVFLPRFYSYTKIPFLTPPICSHKFLPRYPIKSASAAHKLAIEFKIPAQTSMCSRVRYRYYPPEITIENAHHINTQLLLRYFLSILLFPAALYADCRESKRFEIAVSKFRALDEDESGGESLFTARARIVRNANEFIFP
jgi:hypothetical protein